MRKIAETKKQNDATPPLRALFRLCVRGVLKGDDERSPPVSPPGLYLTAVHDAAGGAGATWSPQLAPVVQHMANTFRAETLKLLTKVGPGGVGGGLFIFCSFLCRPPCV